MTKHLAKSRNQKEVYAADARKVIPMISYHDFHMILLVTSKTKSPPRPTMNIQSIRIDRADQTV